MQWVGERPAVALGGLGMALWGVMIAIGSRRNRIITRAQYHESTFVSDSMCFLREHEKATFLLGYPIRSAPDSPYRVLHHTDHLEIWLSPRLKSKKGKNK